MRLVSREREMDLGGDGAGILGWEMRMPVLLLRCIINDFLEETAGEKKLL